MTDRPLPPTIDGLRARRDEILDLTAQYGVSNVRIFGSVARGESTPESDVDLLVDFPSQFSLLDLSALWQDLQELLGYPVNILSDGALKERFRERIQQDLITL